VYDRRSQKRENRHKNEPFKSIEEELILSLGFGKSIGVIAPGCDADIIAVAGDPLQNISVRATSRL